MVVTVSSKVYYGKACYSSGTTHFSPFCTLKEQGPKIVSKFVPVSAEKGHFCLSFQCCS